MSTKTDISGGLHALSGRRRWVNTLTRLVVALGGGAVIAAIALIFFYLLWVVAPVFTPADIEDGPVFAPKVTAPLFLDVNESDEIGLVFGADGAAVFWNLADGSDKSRMDFDQPLVAVKQVYPLSATYAVLDADGRLNVLEARYPISFAGDRRSIGAELAFLFSEEWYDLGQADDFDVHYADSTLAVASLAGSTLTLARFQEAEPDFELEFPRTRQIELQQDYEIGRAHV